VVVCIRAPGDFCVPASALEVDGLWARGVEVGEVWVRALEAKEIWARGVEVGEIWVRALDAEEIWAGALDGIEGDLVSHDELDVAVYDTSSTSIRGLPVCLLGRFPTSEE